MDLILTILTKTANLPSFKFNYYRIAKFVGSPVHMLGLIPAVSVRVDALMQPPSLH